MNILPRRKFTDAVVVAIANGTGKPCSASQAPDGGGWQGEIEDSDFVPYVVVEAAPSQSASGPIADPQADVSWVYSLYSYGDSRDMCEWMADKARQSVTDLIKSVVDLGDGYSGKCLFAWVESYGGVMRSSDAPLFFAQMDTMSFSVTPS